MHEPCDANTPKNMTSPCSCEPTGRTCPERRTFLGRLLLTLTGLTGLAGLLAWLRVLSPNVLYEPPKKIKVGPPDTIQEGITFFKEAKAFVFKNSREQGQTKLYAISASCTHLGCLVQYTPGLEHAGTEVGFSCACHGSRYSLDGDVLKGPAPRSLPWFRLELAPDDGQLIVDTGAQVNRHHAFTI